ncbi:MAG: DUF4234 domain-containing protein, partial [Moraxellaceae bacterium]|nr:DUF4234 domain-containing protein [Moraxellaceae bacterium]
MDNLYEPPKADLLLPEEQEKPGALFTTSILKLVFLCVATLGIYSIYWFYKHWQTLKPEMPEIQPASRSIFSYFFVHELFMTIAKKHEAAGLGKWEYNSSAWLYILFSIISQTADDVLEKADFVIPLYLVPLLV